MRKYIFIIPITIATGLFLNNAITFANDFQVTIRQVLERPTQFENQSVEVSGRLMTIPTRANPYGEYVLRDDSGNWMHVKPWLPKGQRIKPGQRAFGKGGTMAHQAGKRFLIKGELNANIEPVSGKPKRGISGSHYLIVKAAQEMP
ncbi:MAG: hypothetical protein HY886_04335 [Deltaproteobacteria bacterium]|nr:hypothetical protein [Deltaproteobacteria bacterium]